MVTVTGLFWPFVFPGEFKNLEEVVLGLFICQILKKNLTISSTTIGPSR
jgi:hypothetical protein